MNQIEEISESKKYREMLYAVQDLGWEAVRDRIFHET